MKRSVKHNMYITLAKRHTICTFLQYSFPIILIYKLILIKN